MKNLQTVEFLSRLRQLGVRLVAEGDRLRCSAAEGVLTPELRGNIAERKAEILSFLRGAASLPSITPSRADRHQPFPLTETQQAYWLGRGGTFELGQHSIHGYVELEVKRLELSRLTAALRRMIERHEMLRAVLLPTGEQRILEHVPPYEIAVQDLRGLAPEEAKARLDEATQRLSHQVLSLESWPPFEFFASRLDEERTRLHVSIDGLFFDLWSFQMLFRELDQLYKDLDARFVPEQLELSFRDYVLGERALQETEVYQRSLASWRARMETLPPAPELPLACTPAELREPRYRRWNGALDARSWSLLRRLATQAGLTPSGLLLAAYAEVMGGWSRSPRFSLNVPLFNRLPLHREVNKVLGNFSSFTLVEVDCSVKGGFLERARRLQQQLREGMEHQMVSGVRILRELRKGGGEAARTGMPVVFTFVPAGVDAEDAASTHVLRMELGEVIESLSQTPQVWIDNQSHMEEGGALSFNWDVVENLFPAGMVDDMFEAYGQLLRRLAEDERAWRTESLGLLPRAQREQREALTARTQPRVAGGLVHDRFLAQVAASPERLAVITPREALSYGELSHRSHQIARWLRHRGLGPNQLVAVVMEKGWEQVAGALGVLLSGAAYLPIDPSFPRERIHSLLKEGEVRCILTQSWLNGPDRWPVGLEVLDVDGPAREAESGAPLESIQRPEDLMYVLYTSGSSGQPKGVMIEHRAVMNVIVNTNELLRVGAADRMLAVTALEHDLSVYDVFGVLAAGAALVMPEADRAREPAHWLELMVRERVTLWNSVPAMMEMLLSYAAERGERLPASLRWAVLGGDWIPVSLPTRLRTLAEGARVLSIGGPTETTIWNIWYPVDQVDPTWKSIPYGRPIPHARYHVLDEALEDRPVWVAGELYCSGEGLARGYWRDEARTRERFLQHPRTGERLYRTGDLGRYLPDGNIEFLGRADFQLKVNGYRIEPGEIEAHLTRHPGVRAAVVTAVGEHDARQLVAYVVPAGGGRAGTEALLPGAQLDAISRAEFKLRRLGLRQPEPGQNRLPLSKSPASAEVTQAFLRRQSHRTFSSEAVPFERFSALLARLLQRQLEGYTLPKALYPSGGGLYPVHVYLSVKPGRVEGLEGGLYYYHPVEHELVLLSRSPPPPSALHAAYNLEIAERAAFSLFLVGKLSAIEPAYGELSEHFCLLEAGHVGQLLMEAAPEQGIGLCPIGALDFEPLRGLLGCAREDRFLYNLLGGAISPAQQERWSEGGDSPKTPARLIEEMRASLERQLPRHMIPSVFMLLDRLPLSPNGKLDRKALPLPSAARQEPLEAVAPRTETERKLADLWSDVLGRQEFSVHDDFFQRGGDSLAGTRVLSRLRSTFGLELPLRVLFEKKQLAELAEYIDSIRLLAGAGRPPLAEPGEGEEGGVL